LFHTVSRGGASYDELDKAAFQQLMLSHGFTLYQHPEILNSFFNALDADESGFIDKHELYAAEAAMRTTTTVVDNNIVL
jgi:hypothetical protein